MTKILITAVILLAIFFIIVIVCDTNRFTVSHYKIADPRIKHDTRFVVLSDLHGKEYGQDNEKLLEAIRECKPDAILVAGDMLTAKRGRDFTKVISFLEKIAEEYPIYYGNGNHEFRIKVYPETYGDMGEMWQKALTNIGISPLCNERTKHEKTGAWIYGLEINRYFYKRLEKTEMTVGYLERELGKSDEKTFQILIAHNPKYFKAYAAWGADLVISGHVHGGIMRLPFVRGVVSPSLGLFPKYSCGQYREGKSTILVSRGLGAHTIPIRVFNPGELMVVDLTDE